MASSTLPMRGLWLPAMNSLKVGTKSKKSCRMNRAVSLSPPVRALILISSQSAALLRFLRDNQAGATQLGQIGRVALGVARDERRHVRDGGVVAEDADNGVDKGALAVRPGAVGEDKGVLGRSPGAAIANVALQEALQFGVCRR